MEQELEQFTGDNLSDWVEEFGGEEFKKALAAAQLESIDATGEEEEVEKEAEGVPSERRIQSVAERLERRRAAASTPAKEEAEPAPQEAEQPIEAAVQPPQITEDDLRRWLGDEWDTMTDAQKKVAFLNYYNYVALNQVVAAMQALAQSIDKRLEEFVAQAEEEEAVEELTQELIDVGTRAGLSEDELVEVAQIMEEQQILNPRAAVEYYILRKSLRAPANVSERSVRRAAPAPQTPPAAQPTQATAEVSEEEASSFADFVRKVLPRTPEGRQLLRRMPI